MNVRFFLFFALVPFAQACTLGSDTYITAGEGVKPAEEPKPNATTAPTSSPSGASGTCSSAFTKPDLAKLTACSDGKGHCFDRTKVELASQLTPCPDASQVCVPDEILEAAGTPLRTCTSIIGAGACVTASLFPQIQAQGGSALGKDVCDADQLCVPCKNPLDDTATPFCQPIGVREAACAGGAGPVATTPPPAEESCCGTAGRCIVESAIPEEQRGSTVADTCSTGKACVPAAFVAGQPVTCSAGFLGRGVCLNECFNTMLSMGGSIGFLSRATCADQELCIPCTMAEIQGKVPGCS